MLGQGATVQTRSLTQRRLADEALEKQLKALAAEDAKSKENGEDEDEGGPGAGKVRCLALAKQGSLCESPLRGLRSWSYLHWGRKAVRSRRVTAQAVHAARSW